ncbi:MAG: hypothetical protein ABR606_03310 [Vicinamibacterales bacterium]
MMLRRLAPTHPEIPSPSGSFSTFVVTTLATELATRESAAGR